VNQAGAYAACAAYVDMKATSYCSIQTTSGAAPGEIKAPMHLISSFWPHPVKSGALMLLISSCRPLSADSGALLLLIPFCCPLLADSGALMLLIPFCCPLSAESEGFIPLIFQASNFWGFSEIPDTRIISSFGRISSKLQRDLSTTDEYHNSLNNQVETALPSF
jgi:hypothetical protein